MRCPFCNHTEDRVLDSRPHETDSAIRRKRECRLCRRRFVTLERVELLPLMVVKADGRREIFDPSKIKKGILKACEKRPVSIDAIEKVIARVSELVQDYVMEIPSRAIGEMVLKSLKPLDAVAYVRFASVYRQFGDLEEFSKIVREIGAPSLRPEDSKKQEVESHAQASRGRKKS
ncbi:MAG: transcriptional repressor NrdR [Elusimicrobia bacterium]|nr:transcriptional repressor NrdR [Elusimicrobiota bacterium]